MRFEKTHHIVLSLLVAAYAGRKVVPTDLAALAAAGLPTSQATR
jgi:hypothetical protein